MFYTGAAFPGASALKYYDSGNNVPSLVLYRDGVFNEPTGGWQKPGRRYVVIKSGTVFRYFLILKKNAKTAILITIIIIQLFILYFIFNKLNTLNVSTITFVKIKTTKSYIYKFCISDAGSHRFSSFADALRKKQCEKTLFGRGTTVQMTKKESRSAKVVS